MSNQNKKNDSKRVVLHIDMDAFYAAIEELDNAGYRGKPLVVGADPKEGRGRGVVSTANYEARKYGIHSAMPISQAYRRCPHAVYVRGRMSRYGEISRKVMGVLKNYSPKFLQISVDEAFLDVTQTVHPYGSARELVQNLKARIRNEVGLTASVGIASNMFIAKIASDLNKPDGLTVCLAGKEKEFLAPLPIKKLWGVGPKTEAKLHDYGFKTIGDLAKCSRDDLVKHLGKWGAHLWQLSNGIDHRPVEDWGARKSISQEYTFDEDVDDTQVLEQRLWKIADDLSQYMRRSEVKGRVITLKIRLEGFLTYTRRQTLRDYTNDALLMREIATKLFRSFDRQDKKVRLIGIGMSNLNTHGGEQLELFSQSEKKESDRITTLLDTVREKFGDDAAQRASLVGYESYNYIGAEKSPAKS